MSTENSRGKVEMIERSFLADPSMKQFHLLLQILQSNGKPLLSGSFTGRSVAEIVNKYARMNPIEVEVMNDRDVIVQLESDVPMAEAARLLHRTHDWFGQVVRISCLLSTRASIEGIMADREQGRARLVGLERDQ